MLHVGLDLSRRRLDICLLDEHGGLVAETAAPPDADGLRGLAERLAGLGPVRAVIESMNGARFVHDTLEEHGWEVLVADAQKVKGLAPAPWRRSCRSYRPQGACFKPRGVPHNRLRKRRREQRDGRGRACGRDRRRRSDGDDAGGRAALAGVDAVIVERRAARWGLGSRSGRLHARTIEVLDQRGVGERFVSQGQVAQWRASGA